MHCFRIKQDRRDEEMIWYIAICVGIGWVGWQVKKSRYSFERELKKCESPIEEQLMKAFYQKGYKPYAQVSCGKYRIDISIYYKGHKIAIECDGKQYHSSKEQLEHDRIKDMVLERNRWKVYRFTGSMIYKDAAGCVERVEKNIK